MLLLLYAYLCVCAWLGETDGKSKLLDLDVLRSENRLLSRYRKQMEREGECFESCLSFRKRLLTNCISHLS